MAVLKDYMERDMVGYSGSPPKVEWPGQALLAVNIVVNHEEGGEACVLHGDDACETIGIDSISAPMGVRDLDIEGSFEYGSRVAFWRLLDIFSEHDIKVTFLSVGRALEMNPQAATAITANGHEHMDHGYIWGRWGNLNGKTREEERAMHLRSIAAFERITGQRPAGQFIGTATLQTRELLMELGYLYDSNWIGGDIPTFVSVQGKPCLLVPYTFNLNDGRYFRSIGYVEPGQFFREAKATFDQLYKESAKVPKMMTMSLHVRVSGLPARANAVDRFIAYARSFPRVWFARRDEIAKVWWEQFGPAGY